MAATMTLTVAEYLCLTTGTTSGAGSAYIENIFTYFIERMNSFINHSIFNHVK